jgi:mannose-6-phosphate isomerase-like protein (cupin superfamily)
MAHSGVTIENPVTRERLTFLATRRETNGELLRFEHIFAPGGFVPAAHLHPRQEERFEVLSGSPRFRIGEEERAARPGERLVVPAGVPHTWWNEGEDETHVIVEVRPALRTEVIFETHYGLARDGKLNKRALPNPLFAAVLAQEFQDEVRVAPQKEILLSRLPAPVIAILIAVLAPLGRLLGYRGTYPRYSPDDKP